MADDGPIVELAEVGSTNDWIIAQAALGAPDGLWVRADRQTAGRGRRGRTWASQAGNLFASTLVRARPGEGPPAQLSFVAALALHDALSEWAPGRLQLKWPNDVLLDSLKCSGILLEGVEGATVIGVGVNLASHPTDSERPATSIAATGVAPPAPQVFADSLRHAFASRRAAWSQEGFGVVREAWMARAHAHDAPLVARLGAEAVEGRYAGVADDGALRLTLADGSLRLIHAGEVFGL